MKLEWMIIAEGFGTAANGAVTVIGINQGVIIAPVLPVTTKRGVMAHYAEASGDEAGQDLEVSIRVTDPSGGVLLTQTAPARLSFAQPWPESPSGVDIFLEIPLRLSEYGAYEISLAMTTPNGESVAGRVPLYVRESIPG